MVPHPKTPILNCFYHLLWFYFLTVSEFSCFSFINITGALIKDNVLVAEVTSENFSNRL